MASRAGAFSDLLVGFLWPLLNSLEKVIQGDLCPPSKETMAALTGVDQWVGHRPAK